MIYHMYFLGTCNFLIKGDRNCNYFPEIPNYLRLITWGYNKNILTAVKPLLVKEQKKSFTESIFRKKEILVMGM